MKTSVPTIDLKKLSEQMVVDITSKEQIFTKLEDIALHYLTAAYNAGKEGAENASR